MMIIQDVYKGPMKVTKESGDRIRQLINHSITRSLAQFLTQKCGLTPTNFYPFLNGKATCKYEHLERVLNEIGYSVSCELKITIVPTADLVNTDDTQSSVEDAPRPIVGGTSDNPIISPTPLTLHSREDSNSDILNE